MPEGYFFQGKVLEFEEAKDPRNYNYRYSASNSSTFRCWLLGVFLVFLSLLSAGVYLGLRMAGIKAVSPLDCALGALAGGDSDIGSQVSLPEECDCFELPLFDKLK